MNLTVFKERNFEQGQSALIEFQLNKIALWEDKDYSLPYPNPPRSLRSGLIHHKASGHFPASSEFEGIVTRE